MPDYSQVGTDPFSSLYSDFGSPAGGTSPFGTVGGTYDVWNPAALPIGAYGTMPDYSKVGADPLASLYGGSDTAYDPLSDSALYSGDTSWMDTSTAYDPYSDEALYSGDTSWMDYGEG
jgi:hypothetical protein